MKQIKFLQCFLLSFLLLGFLSCSEDDPQTVYDEFADFENQNIPQELCGTYYEVEKGDSYYQSLTINSDGTMYCIYFSNGQSNEERGKCFYNEDLMFFYYKAEDGEWMRLYGAEFTVVEWTSEHLVLGGSSKARFLTKSKQTPSFFGKECDEDLIGKWTYRQNEVITHTLILKENRSGSNITTYYEEGTYYETVNTANWFTLNKHLFIKYNGETLYDIWRYDLSGETLELCYCIGIFADNPYRYHNDESGVNNDDNEDIYDSISGYIRGYEYVDLGLSVKWAAYNVGVSSPEGYGNYYAWGETTTKTNYTESSYQYHNGSYVNIGRNISGTQYDVARSQWGGSWRMPTEAEFQELINRCTWTRTIYNDVNGYKVTGPNGNSIFLPAAGYRDGTEFYNFNSLGYYWSGSLNESNQSLAYYLDFGSDGRYVLDIGREVGLTVRPVSE